MRTERSFRQQLRLPASILWADVPLRRGLQQLCRTQRTAWWLDRRLDPLQPVTFQSPTGPLAGCLRQLSEGLEPFSVSWTSNVVYVGPPDAANRFASMHRLHLQQLGELPAAARRSWQRRRTLQWDQPQTPQNLLREITTSAGIRLSRQQHILHDLWAPHQLPSISAMEQIELVLAGFDLTFRLAPDGSATIIRMPAAPQYRDTYRITASNRADFTQRLRQVPDASWVDRRRGQVLADWKGHLALANLLDPPPAAATEDLRFTLRVTQQPVGPLLQQLAKQVNLRVAFSPAAKAKCEQRVSFDVRQATLEQLFSAATSGAGLSFRQAGGVLQVDADSDERQ